jgi:hypothetical protein
VVAQLELVGLFQKVVIGLVAVAVAVFVVVRVRDRRRTGTES